MRPEGGIITGCDILEFPNESIAQCGRRRRAKDWPWDRFRASPVRRNGSDRRSAGLSCWAAVFRFLRSGRAVP